MSNGGERAVIEATHAFYDALSAMLEGDPEPLRDVYSHGEDVFYMPAEGGVLVGWDEVYADWSRQAAASRGGTAEAADVRVIAGTDLAYSQTVTDGTVTAPDGEVHRVHLRESSVFRREDGAWKMAAHHADAIPDWTRVVEGG